MFRFTPADPNVREATLTADYLTSAGVSHKVIQLETESTSTITNFTNSIDLVMGHSFGRTLDTA